MTTDRWVDGQIDTSLLRVINRMMGDIAVALIERTFMGT